MFKGLIKGLKGEPKKEPRLPVVGEAGLGRAVRIDPSMLEAMEAALGERVSPDLVITGHGLAELPGDGAGEESQWLHRFYDDEHRMLQALTMSAEGGEALEWSFYVPAGAEYPAIGQTRADLRERLTKAEFAHDGQPFARLWYEGDPADQPPVEFTEAVFETADMSDPTAIEQACMVYGRETGRGELLLLAILTGEGPDSSLERMLGTGLRPHQIGV